MSDYDNRILSSDVDAFKHSGEIQTVAMVISGNVAAGGEKTVTSEGITVDNLDFYEVTFDNSAKHSGKYHSLNEGLTFVRDTSSGTDFTFALQALVSGSTMSFSAYVLNTTASILTLQTTTINFRYVPYEATIV